MSYFNYLLKSLSAKPKSYDLRNCKFFLDNYGKSQVYSGMYPVYWGITIFHLAFMGAHCGFLIYTAYLGFDDMALFAESTHFAIILGSMTMVLVNFAFYSKKNEEVFWAFDRGIHDYKDTVDELSQREIKTCRDKSNERKEKYAKFFSYALYLAILMLGLFRPLFEYYTGKYDNPKYDDGITRWMPVNCWLPYDTSQVPYRILAISSHHYMIAAGLLVIFGNDVVFLCLAEEFIYELKVISLLIKNIRKRAEYVMKKKFNKKPKNIYKNPLWTLCIRECLSHSVKHHSTLIKVFYKINEIMYHLLIILLFGSIYLLCLSGILFTSDKVPLAPKLTFASILGGELAHAFLFCWYGQKIQDLNGELRNIVYQTDWINYSSAVKHHFIIMQIRSLRDLKLSAGGFTDASLKTFGNVLNSAFSYFNLLQASKLNE